MLRKRFHCLKIDFYLFLIRHPSTHTENKNNNKPVCGYMYLVWTIIIDLLHKKKNINKNEDETLFVNTLIISSNGFVFVFRQHTLQSVHIVSDHYGV